MIKFLTTINIILSFCVGVVLLGISTSIDKVQTLEYLVYGCFVWSLYMLYILDSVVTKTSNVKFEWYHRLSLFVLGLLHLFIFEYYIWIDDIWYTQVVANISLLTFIANTCSFSIIKNR